MQNGYESIFNDIAMKWIKMYSDITEYLLRYAEVSSCNLEHRKLRANKLTQTKNFKKETVMFFSFCKSCHMN